MSMPHDEHDASAKRNLDDLVSDHDDGRTAATLLSRMMWPVFGLIALGFAVVLVVLMFRSLSGE